jgi:hypothetical protein
MPGSPAQHAAVSARARHLAAHDLAAGNGQTSGRAPCYTPLCSGPTENALLYLRNEQRLLRQVWLAVQPRPPGVGSRARTVNCRARPAIHTSTDQSRQAPPVGSSRPRPRIASGAYRTSVRAVRSVRHRSFGPIIPRLGRFVKRPGSREQGCCKVGLALLCSPAVALRVASTAPRCSDVASPRAAAVQLPLNMMQSLGLCYSHGHENGIVDSGNVV